MHLADAFIQSDLQCIQAIFFCQYVDDIKLYLILKHRNDVAMSNDSTNLKCSAFR